MNRFSWSLLLTIAFAAILVGCSQDVVAPDHEAWSRTKSVAASQFCLLLHEGSDMDAVVADYGLTVIETFGNDILLLTQGTPDLAALALDERVREVQQNGLSVLSSPVDITLGFYEGDWDDVVLGQQTAFSSLQLDRMHTIARGDGVTVAVLDTGIDPNHPMLASHVQLLPPGVLSSLEDPNGVDDDGDGLIDEAFGHGTHVAGIVSQIAPGATILPIRVLNADGFGSAFELAMGLYTAYEQGAQIVNLSLVLSGESNLIERVLRDVTDGGMLVVGAAGNQPGPAFFPADDSHVLSVAAMDAWNIATFSASEDVRLGAPGTGIISTYPSNGAAVASGTSMACAVVSGSAAVIRQLVGGERVEHLLRATSRPRPPLKDGSIRPLAALREALRTPVLPPYPQDEVDR